MVITNWTRVATFASFAVLVSSVSAQQFRIESQVYSAGEKTPVAESLTLYDGGYAFDFSFEPGSQSQEVEIVVFDQARKTLVLLDVKREMRLTLEQYELAKMLEELRLQLSQKQDLNFLVNPQFSEKTDFASGLIELENPKLSYRATCEKPKDIASMSLYYESQDQFTWLAASDPSRLPPFSRLALNQAIKKNGLMPKEIKLHVHSEGLLQRDLDLHSKHSVIWQLSVDDRKRIESAKKKWMTYAPVSLGKFRGLTNGDATKVAESDNSETQTNVKK